MARRKSDDWLADELAPRLRSPKAMGALIFWFIIWAICDFNPWVGVGLFFAAGGSIGLFGGSKRETKDDLWDYDDYEEEDIGRYQGGENDREAQARSSDSNRPILEANTKLHQKVMAEAKASRMQLEAAASVAEGELGTHLRAMVARIQEVDMGLHQDPNKLSEVQRLYTYYLPATADLLAARRTIAGSTDTARLAEIDAMIAKLNLAYTDFASRLRGHDARNLEIDLRLLDQSLDDEFAHKSKG
ncbi:5-bromo-4-chloroindolyl phosphate hydrolysis family protein [Candidatus Phycosocius spiralis]|uniref:5-bromo-4-chloroindolyl phosphate hydrolysis protein n=1 Tax=Candidatus Phycosocius spiralis TaxID=2815099 RepID=A0ABQ4PXU1_9PROT|nr:5-bromo-4-chloroindolyl phosphate hydrolysis family protein [Candidatus Phycosocius spiralis]GIU67828.1 hypothetical protein PsB1_1982 [Candidatus Phycosocius spiralis]